MVTKMFKTYPDVRKDIKTRYVVLDGNLWNVYKFYDKKSDAVQRAKYLRDWTAGLSKNVHGKKIATHIRVVKSDKGWAVIQQSPFKQYQVPKKFLINGEVQQFIFG